MTLDGYRCLAVKCYTAEGSYGYTESRATARVSVPFSYEDRSCTFPAIEPSAPVNQGK